MKKKAVEVGSVLIIFLVALLVGPSGQRLAGLAASALRQRVAGVHVRIKQATSLVGLALPRLARLLANVLTGMASAIIAFSVYFMVVGPVQIHSLHRKVSRVESQLALLTGNLEHVSELLADLGRTSIAKPGIEQGSFVAKSPSTESHFKINPPPKPSN